jgi:hypothetical protein
MSDESVSVKIALRCIPPLAEAGWLIGVKRTQGAD